MMKWTFFALVVVSGILVFAAKSHGDPSVGVPSGLAPPPPSAHLEEGIGSARGHEPFTPYSTGPGAWRYSDLTAEEMAQADHAKSSTNWAAINAGYEHVVQEQAEAADALAADHQLGIENSSALGVVP